MKNLLALIFLALYQLTASEPFNASSLQCRICAETVALYAHDPIISKEQLLAEVQGWCKTMGGFAAQCADTAAHIVPDIYNRLRHTNDWFSVCQFGYCGTATAKE